MAAAVCATPGSDVYDEASFVSGFEGAVREPGGIDVLASNAGARHLDYLVEVSIDNCKRILAIHLDGGFLTSRACRHHVIAQRRRGAM